jgi:hypothetical protein
MSQKLYRSIWILLPCCLAYVQGTVLDRPGAAFEGCLNDKFENVSNKGLEKEEICSHLQQIVLECRSDISVTSELDLDSDIWKKVLTMFGPETSQLCDSVSSDSTSKSLKRSAADCNITAVYDVGNRFENCRSAYNTSIESRVRKDRGDHAGAKHVLDQLCKDFPAETNKCLEIAASCNDKENITAKINRIIEETHKITSLLGSQDFEECYFGKKQKTSSGRSFYANPTVIFFIGVLVTLYK